MVCCKTGIPVFYGCNSTQTRFHCRTICLGSRESCVSVKTKHEKTLQNNRKSNLFYFSSSKKRIGKLNCRHKANTREHHIKQTPQSGFKHFVTETASHEL